MTAPADARDLERSARARAAITRIRIRRALSERQRRESYVDIGLALFVAAVAIGLFVLGIFGLIEITGLRYAELVSHSMLFVAALTIVGSAGLVTLLLGTFAALWVGYGIFRTPVWIVKWIRAGVARRRLTGFEDTLAARGEVGIPQDTRPRHLGASVLALANLGRADAALEFLPASNTVRVRDAGPPAACPRCPSPSSSAPQCARAGARARWRARCACARSRARGR